MIQNSSGENLDRLLSDFFKSQLKQPWPAAPATTVSEPSALVASRAATSETPRNQPAARDSNARSRYTLAVSVALLLGTCWYLSNGFQPGNRSGPTTPAGGGMIGGAEGSKPKALETIREDNAVNGKGRPAPPPIKLP
jgi:hypothetical protein